ncbi:MAG TPA: hypothetical protein VGR07_17460 [Thermoanaerobaculia bacterium]|jgi:hypothetical protein|nr:hypothetical protein [Thermoanaerobaculia bacterium]
MKRPHLLVVEEGPERFAPLFTAAREIGLRIGWLDFPDPSAPTAPPPALPADLEAAAGQGALRAVAAGGGRSVAVKPLRGAPVLGDLLREHFRGCALVLVRGAVEAPRLTLEGESWKVAQPGEAARLYATGDLAAALRRPRPWT